MGRTSIAKQRKIERFRNEGLTQQEAAKKLRVDIRTVRKYDPLREQKPVMPTAEQLRQVEEDCNVLAAEDLLQKGEQWPVPYQLFGEKSLCKIEEVGKEGRTRVYGRIRLVCNRGRDREVS